jgi:hypothetical protein
MQLQHLLRTAQLDLDFKKSSDACRDVIEDEKTRRLRLQILLLEHERSSLCDQIELDDDRAEALLRERDEFEDDYLRVQAELSVVQNEHRVRLRELDQAKVSYS